MSGLWDITDRRSCCCGSILTDLVIAAVLVDGVANCRRWRVIAVAKLTTVLIATVTANSC
jgi:hypothetical protein